MRIKTIEQWIGEDNKVGLDIWHKKYQQNDESFTQWLDRVSGGNPVIRQLIIEKKFLFGGRILSNRGLQNQGRKITYSNCYVIEPPQDNIESIFETASRLARTFSYGGGCGIDISKLSPRGAKINNSAKETTGAVSFMELYNLVTGLIGQNGRRGALMLSIDCTHPDLEEFISVKNDLNSITKANISVKITDEFMQAVINDDDFDLIFVREETGEEIIKRVNAKVIFEKLCRNNWDFAEPGMLFWDKIKSHNLLSNNPNFEYAGVNPCAEEPLPAGGSCLLGSINLAEFVDNGKFNKDDFLYTVRSAVIALNEVLDEGLELHPLEEQINSVRDWRQIGLGIFGLGDMLIKMGVVYGSEAAIDICDGIGLYMINEAIKTSAEIAKLKGSYPNYDKELMLRNNFFNENTLYETRRLVEKYGLRNSQLLTIAPTGSLSTMLGVTGGIEPMYDTHYVRKTEALHNKDQYYTIFTPIVDEYMKKNNITNVEDLPGYFVTAKTLAPMNRIGMQAVWQKHIDASISSTVNLHESATVEDVMILYKDAWKKGLKGITIFRDKCARTGILSEAPKQEENPIRTDEEQALIEKIECGDMNIDPATPWSPHPSLILDTIHPITRDDLGSRLNGTSYVKQTACGKLYITINRDEDDNLVEVFIDPGKSGGCVANAESLGRFASACMRGGMAVDAIVDITKGVKCAACTKAKGRNKKVDGLSCGDIVARTIEEEYKRYHCAQRDDSVSTLPYLSQVANMISGSIDAYKIKPSMTIAVDSVYNNACPECGEQIANEGGCVICKDCGWSKCD